MNIETARKFPHLRNAPVVEAAIDFRASAPGSWDQPNITPLLKASLPDYPTVEDLHSFSVRLPFSNTASASPVTEPAAIWAGLRFTSENRSRIAAFTRDGFTFSRLHPYTRWSKVRAEAMRLWTIHAKTSGATQIQRIGVRYINRLEVPTRSLKFQQYFAGFGSVPGGLPLSSFVFHRTIEVPGQPYRVILIQTIQPPTDPAAASLGLITDIDVVASNPTPNNPRIIEEHLKAMRAIKNTVFFGSVTKKYLALCK